LRVDDVFLGRAFTAMAVSVKGKMRCAACGRLTF
jgi:hypothetical protein